MRSCLSKCLILISNIQEKIHVLYDLEMKYRDEFEKYSVDRLRIVKVI